MRDREASPRASYRVAVLTAVITTQVVFLWAIARHLWFASDDFISFSLASRQPTLTWDYLRQEVFDHFAPAHRLGNWLVQHHATLDWGVVLAVMLGLVAVAILLLARICTQLFGRSWASLALTTAFGTSIVVFALLQWWASALHALPTTVLTLAAISAYLSHAIDGRRWGLPAAVAATTVGLLFYEKAALVPVYCLLVRVFLLQDDLRPRTVGNALRREWRTWAALAVPPAAYVAFYFIDGSYGTKTHAPSFEQFDAYLRIVWLRAFVPALAGFRIPPGDTTSAQEAAVVLCQVLFFAVLAATVVRKRAAWRAWAFLGLGVGINVLLVGLPRVPIYGAGTGYEMRYLTEAAFLFPLALGLALAPRASCPQRFTTSRVPGPGVLVAVTAVLAAHLAAVLWTAPQMRRDWVTDEDHQYVTNVRAGVLALRRAGVQPRLLDTEVPGWVMPGNHGINHMSDLTHIFDPGVSYAGAARVHEAGPDGRLQPLRFVSDPPSGPRWPSGVAVTEAGAGVTEAGVRWAAGLVCVRSAARPVLLERVLKRPLRGAQWGLVLRGSARRATDLAVFVDRGAGYPAVNDRVLRIGPGRDRRWLALGSPDLVKFRIDVPPAAAVCLSGVRTGRYAPDGPPPA